MCKDVHSWACFRFISAKFLASAPPICKRRLMTVMDTATEHPQRIRTDMDVRGSTQQRCFCSTKTRVQKCTRMYTSGQAIFKRLSAKVFSKAFILYGCITASALSLFFVFFILFLENLHRHLPILICIISQSTPRVRFVSINSPHN